MGGKRRGISRRELLARGIALGGVAMAGSPGRLVRAEPLREGASPGAGAESLADLRAALGGELITPADPAYDAARRVWNGMIDKRPSAIVRCSGAADVMNTIRFARDNDLPVSVRGGGHNVAGKALRDGALAIDLSPMDGIHVDPEARTGRAQGGATWGEFDRETTALGLVTTGGTVSTTGVGGLTLGGGLGWLMRQHGLACDNLVSVDVVTADGRLLKASADENADLFWALHGGGGNFGVATSLQFRLHELQPITGGVAVYPFALARDVFRFYREYTSSAPDSVETMAGIMNGPPESPFAGGKAAWINVCHSGPAAEGERLLKPIKEFGPPVIDTIGPTSYHATQTSIDAQFPPGMRTYWRSNFLEDLEDEAIDTILAWSETLPGAPSTLLFEHLQGAVGRVGAHDTAFSNRKAKYDFTILGVWHDRDEDAENIKWTRGFGDAVEALATGAGYVNYMTADEGAGRIRATYETNYERLVAIKRKYDPANFFSVNQNIAPST